MADDKNQETPQSPEVHEGYVRDDLEQDDVTHKGEWRTGNRSNETSSDASKSLGAMEDEVVPIVPPMSGPADLVVNFLSATYLGSLRTRRAVGLSDSSQ